MYSGGVKESGANLTICHSITERVRIVEIRKNGGSETCEGLTLLQERRKGRVKLGC